MDQDEHVVDQMLRDAFQDYPLAIILELMDVSSKRTTREENFIEAAFKTGFNMGNISFSGKHNKQKNSSVDQMAEEELKGFSFERILEVMEILPDEKLTAQEEDLIEAAFGIGFKKGFIIKSEDYGKMAKKLEEMKKEDPDFFK